MIVLIMCDPFKFDQPSAWGPLLDGQTIKLSNFANIFYGPEDKRFWPMCIENVHIVTVLGDVHV